MSPPTPVRALALRLSPAPVLLALAMVLVACGGSDGSKPPAYAAALEGAPPRLAALYAGGDELRDGGADGFQQQLADLRGVPVVVNVWASWCGPCRVEFPHFQRLSARYGDRVAFIGVDAKDDDDAARTYLDEFPIPYPSYRDPDGDIADTVSDYWPPATAFYDSRGRRVYVKAGQYASEADLAADIRRYAR